MATIAATRMLNPGANTLTVTTLTASDTFTYNAQRSPLLLLRNGTAGALTVTIDGAGASTVPVRGVGNVNVAAGYSTGAIPAGGFVAIALRSIEEYLKGAIAVTGGAGISASLLEF
jgi:hypothetical protein